MVITNIHLMTHSVKLRWGGEGRIGSCYLYMHNWPSLNIKLDIYVQEINPKQFDF